MNKKTYSQLKEKFELVFETSKLDSEGQPTTVTAHEVPRNYAEAIPKYFDMMNGGEITIDETAYNSRLRGIREHNPDAIDHLGWLHHKLGPNLGKAGIWGCKLISLCSLDSDSVQRSLFYDNELGGEPEEAVVTQLEPTTQEMEDISESPVEIKEVWTTKNGNFQRGAKLLLVAIDRETGEVITSCEMPENHSIEARDHLKQRAEAILARQKAA